MRLQRCVDGSNIHRPVDNIIWQSLLHTVLINSQYVNNSHANKQLVNSENWSL